MLSGFIDYIPPIDAKMRRAPVDLQWKPVSLSLFRVFKFFNCE